MANLQAVYTVGESLATYLGQAYATLQQTPPPNVNLPTCEFRLFASGDFEQIEEAEGNTLSLFLYRVTLNEHLRNHRRVDVPTGVSQVPLSLNLHYLLTVWAPTANAEHVILAWTMRQLQQQPVLDRSLFQLLDPTWEAEELVQLIPAEVSHEDMMRIWDALDPSYHLSVAYVARVVQVDADPDVASGPPVIATRLSYQTQGVTP
ncbi:MAG: DUF4255 domain-containing protein [Leptolyngbya sp. SIO1E4]|nr:DUF4255 domain-containing protein [Leptolyngbya sp. SIO1E4]